MSDSKTIKNEFAHRLFKDSEKMISDYRNTIRQNGSLLTASMVFAYSKGINDVIKLLLKGEDNGQIEVPETISTEIPERDPSAV